MPFSLGGLLGGATSAVTGAMQGKLDKRKYEEQAMRELLQQQLAEAQLTNYTQQGQDRASASAHAQQESLRRDALRASKPEYANLPGEVLDAVVQSEHKPAAQGDGQYFTDDTGAVTYSQGGAPARPVTGAHGKSKTQTMANADQTKLADFGTSMLEGHAVMTRLEQSVPGIGQRVDAKMRPVFAAEVIPGVGKAIARGALSAALAAMTKEERAYWNAKSRVINARLRRATGAAINAEELDREGAPLAPIAGEDDSILPTKQAARLQGALLYIYGSQNAFNESLLSPEAKRYLHPEAPQLDAQPVSDGAPGEDEEEDTSTNGWRSADPRRRRPR